MDGEQCQAPAKRLRALLKYCIPAHKRTLVEIDQACESCLIGSVVGRVFSSPRPIAFLEPQRVQRTKTDVAQLESSACLQQSLVHVPLLVRWHVDLIPQLTGKR